MSTDLEFSQSVSAFSADIYQNCIDKKSNIILSPLSIQTAISLAMMGAKGKTAEEMATVMKFKPDTHESVANNFQTLMATINDSKVIKIANKIYVQENYPVKAEFNEIATKKFNSEAQNLNFQKSVESAAVINGWVEEKTNNKITNLIDPSVLTSDTRMVLVNAIYFKGFWQQKFKSEQTRPGPFWTSETESVQVDMMHTKARFNYGVFDNLDATAMEMSFNDTDITMLIILPNKMEGLSALESKLQTIDLNAMTSQMYSQEVIVSLPKFKIEYEISLNDVLKKMGMTTMFSDNADFSNLLESPEPLQVSDVIHKAFIEVNEDGAEAAAATAVMMMCRSMPAPSIKFTADHSFLFQLRNKATSHNYFIGSYIGVSS